MKKLLLPFVFALALLGGVGCQHAVTLEAGGAYSDPILATTDRAILDADATLTGFVNWANTNAGYLSQWPEIAQLAHHVTAAKDGWILDAYMARDVYAQAVKAGKDSTGAKKNLDVTMAVLSSLLTQVSQFESAHNPPPQP